MNKIIFSVLAIFVLSCQTPSTKTRQVPKGAKVIFENVKSNIGTYISEPDGFSTESYWIEGPDGLVIIDTQFLLSAANQLIDWAESATGKKVVLAIVLHPNPDKFNGTAVFKNRGIKVITSEQVRSLIPEVHADRYESFFERYKPDYPEKYTLPESFGSKTTEIQAAGLKFKLHVLGKACSGAHVVVEYEKHLFVGDLIASLGHSWLELGHVDSWLKTLTFLNSLTPDFVHPGRGPSGGSELIEREKRYLDRVKELVKKSKKKKDIALKEIYDVMVSENPGYENPYFLELGLEAVWDNVRASGSSRN